MTATQERQMQIAQTILNQLGGRRFILMTGVKNRLATESGLRMDLPRNSSGANRFEVTYDQGMDMYNLHFYRIRMNRKTWDCTVKTVVEFTGIYCDQLQEIFTEVTGLYTHF